MRGLAVCWVYVGVKPATWWAERRRDWHGVKEMRARGLERELERVRAFVFFFLFFLGLSS